MTSNADYGIGDRTQVVGVPDVGEPLPNADYGRTPSKARHFVHACQDALCPCYLDGLRAGAKPTGPSLLRAIEELFAGTDDAPPNDGSET